MVWWVSWKGEVGHQPTRSVPFCGRGAGSGGVAQGACCAQEARRERSSRTRAPARLNFSELRNAEVRRPRHCHALPGRTGTEDDRRAPSTRALLKEP
jgi:hypothetical protein